MGPSKLFHKNRSSHSLLSSQDASDRARFHHSPSESPLNSPGFPPRSQYLDNKEDDDDDDDDDEEETPLPRFAEDARPYQLGHPTRSQSQRSPSLLNTNLQRPTINLVGPAHSTPSSAVDEAPPDSYYRQAPPTVQPAQPAQKEDRKKRRFFGIGSSSKDPPPGATSAKLGRSISVRKRDQLPDHYQEPTRQPVRQEWPSTHVSPTDDYEQEQEPEAGGLQPHPGVGNVALVGQHDKESSYSPTYAASSAQQDYSHGKTATSPKHSRRHGPERQGSYESSWTRASSIVHHHHSHSEAAQQQQTPTSYHPSPVSATSTGSSRQLHHRSPNESLHQHWQEQIPSRPSSQQSLEPPAQGQHSRVYESHHARGSSSQTSSLSHYTQSSMGPPSQPQGPSRRPSEAQQHQQGEPGREGGYQPYAQAAQGGGVLQSNPPPSYTSTLTPQNPTYRGNSQPSPMPQSSHEQGRSTPPPSRSRDDLSNMDYAQLQTRHEELRSLEDKYRKVKKYYFDKDAQVQQLQNTLAHQRLSQSRTSLDDNEYANRFSRLDGAINNLAFNLRRDWRQVPPWLAPHVNRDATTSPTKEMTAVGRAAISRWLVEELLDRFFHPGLDLGLSTQLKIIERNLRRFAPPTPSDEEKDALLAKISNWRLSTLDGLQEILASPQATENRTALTEMLVEKLVAYLGMMLKEPTPAGLEGGVSMIVELAVGISANLPLESRDVFVEYVSPGQLIVDSYMKIESGLPPLTAPGDAPVDGDTTAKQAEETGSVDSRETGTSNGNAAAEDKDQSGGPQAQAGGTAKKKGVFGSFIGGANSGSKKGSIASTASSTGVAPQTSTVAGGASGSIGERKEERVRFATFMAVEVRGRSVLVKAPVYVRE